MLIFTNLQKNARNLYANNDFLPDTLSLYKIPSSFATLHASIELFT